jgi:23S rRNA (uracil1939-C5)-methyltransferase
VLELDVERPVAGGRMLARHEGRVVLVSGAIPGERVRARVERVARDTTWATVTEVLDPSPDRREPVCDPLCGGAAFAHIRYERQRVLKAEIVADAFRRIGKTAVGPLAVEASPERGYRLRARLHIRGRRAGFFLEGTHTLCDAGSTGQVLPGTIAAVDAALAALSDRLAECDALIVTENVDATERVLHVEPRDGARLDDLARRLSVPAGATGLTTAARGRLVTLAGGAAVTDTADRLFAGQSPIDGAVTWTRRATSFFQGNRYLTGSLVRHVVAKCEGQRFADLYAGVGLFAVALAARGGKVWAVEGDRFAGEDLAANVRAWGERIRIVRAPVEHALLDRPADPPDVLIVDPPRTGVSPAALDEMIAWSARRVVYVSCDPPTLARDATKLVAAGYAIGSLDGFDLFPNTPHVEVVAVFDRRPD